LVSARKGREPLWKKLKTKETIVAGSFASWYIYLMWVPASRKSGFCTNTGKREVEEMRGKI
jgi:hypothetical protein